MNLVDSISRIRYQDSWEPKRLPESGQENQMPIVPRVTSNSFQVDHWIRMGISSSKFSQFDVDPNTGELLGRQTHTVITRNTLQLGRAIPRASFYHSFEDDCAAVPFSS